jgi:type IV pilus assembly protein PilW
MSNTYSHTLPLRRDARGFSVVELMVAVAISVFLLAGLFSVLQSTHKASDNERLLAQLQDDQRIAMTLFTNVIESAGYYSNALTSGSLLTALPADATFANAGQVVAGGTNAQGDTITLRYQADAGDAAVLTCQGTTLTGATPHTSSFSVDAKGNLQCSIDGNAPVTLISGVKSMQILYGVGSAITLPNSAGSVDSYLTAAGVNAVPVRWSNVYTVRVTLTFNNPLVLGGTTTLQAGQTATITFSRIVSIKSRTGVNVANYI